MALRIPTKKHRKTNSLIVPSDLPKLKQYNSEAKEKGRNDSMTIIENVQKTPYQDEQVKIKR